MPALTRIDELLRPQHFHLLPDDECYVLREYTARQGFNFSHSNDLILNLKKSPLKRNSHEWKYKARAISQAAAELRQSINPQWLVSATLVPMPPSKAVGDPEYDDRMLQVVQELRGTSSYDVRQLILQNGNVPPSHGGIRASTAHLASCWSIDPNVAHPPPTAIGVFDDVLTRGTHFRAAKTVLQARFGSSLSVVGFFIARAVHVVESEP